MRRPKLRTRAIALALVALVIVSLAATALFVIYRPQATVDGDYRLQGWFTPELEVGITRAWLIEGITSFVDRGRGLELGTWRAETRYVPFEEPRWPIPSV